MFKKVLVVHLFFTLIIGIVCFAQFILIGISPLFYYTLFPVYLSTAIILLVSSFSTSRYLYLEQPIHMALLRQTVATTLVLHLFAVLRIYTDQPQEFISQIIYFLFLLFLSLLSLLIILITWSVISAIGATAEPALMASRWLEKKLYVLNKQIDLNVKSIQAKLQTFKLQIQRAQNSVREFNKKVEQSSKSRHFSMVISTRELEELKRLHEELSKSVSVATEIRAVTRSLVKSSKRLVNLVVALEKRAGEANEAIAINDKKLQILMRIVHKKQWRGVAIGVLASLIAAFLWEYMDTLIQ